MSDLKPVRMMREIHKMNRAERKAMADSRAMEEQMERENILSGSGATPSMGLSQIRGGKKMMKNASAQGKQLMEHLGSLHGGAYAKQFHEGMKGSGFFSNLGHGLSDVAGMFGLGKECEKEKVSGGLHTGRYEGEGTTFSKDEQDFSGHRKGRAVGAGFFSNLGHGLSDVAGMFGLGKITAVEKKVLESILKKHQKGGPMEDMLPDSEMSGLQNVIKKHGGKRGPVPYGRPQKPVMELMVEAEGSGRFSDLGHKVSDIAGMFGLGKQKRVVGASDGRRKRAEIVKQVMMEKGLKLIDASKYVKEHNLYKP